MTDTPAAPIGAGEMTDLDIAENSGVDMPAHGEPGWIVMKAGDVGDLEDAMNAAAQAAKNVTEAAKAVAKNDSPETDAPPDAADVSTTADEGQEENSMPEDTNDEKDPAAETGDGDEETSAATGDGSERTVTKSKTDVDAPTKAEIENISLTARLEKAEKDLEAMRSEREIEKAAADITAWGALPGVDAAELAPHIQTIRKAAPESAKAVEAALSAAASTISTSVAMGEIGTSEENEAVVSAASKIAKAAADMDDMSDLSPEAIQKAANANPELWEQYRRDLMGL